MQPAKLLRAGHRAEPPEGETQPAFPLLSFRTPSPSFGLAPPLDDEACFRTDHGLYARTRSCEHAGLCGHTPFDNPYGLPFRLTCRIRHDPLPRSTPTRRLMLQHEASNSFAEVLDAFAEITPETVPSKRDGSGLPSLRSTRREREDRRPRAWPQTVVSDQRPP